jgi:hypothetical protein
MRTVPVHNKDALTLSVGGKLTTRNCFRHQNVTKITTKNQSLQKKEQR